MRRLSLAVLPMLLVAACGEDPALPQAEGFLSGHLFMTGPVSGANIAGRGYDPMSGQLGDLIDEAVTDENGAFTLNMGIYEGPVMLVARGAAAGYTEPATGADASFEASTVIRAALVDWRVTGVDLEFGFDFKDDRKDVVISPLSELAVAYAESRQRIGLSDTFAEALEESVLLWLDHWQYDYWRVLPLPLTATPVGPFNERVHAGVIMSGLSYHARRIAVASSLSPAAVSSLSVLEILKLDLGDSVAQLDGFQTGSTARLTLGACPTPTSDDETTICQFSGQTLRSRLNEAVGLFLLDESLNRSGLVYNDVKDLMQGIACRSSVLFPAEACVPDSLGPVIELVSVQENDPVTGDLAFSVRVRDEQQMGEILPVELDRGRNEAPDYEPLSVIRDTTSPATHTAEVLFDSTAIADGPLRVTVRATDAAGNESVARVTVNVDNTGKGSVFGNVNAGGAGQNCLITVFDVTDGTQGAVLGSAITESDGDYEVEIAESPGTTALLVVASKPLDGEATYVEMTSGATISFSSDDVLESVITDYVDGDVGRVVNVNPYTHMATALARARYGGGTGVDPIWADAVETAFAAFDEHFVGGPTIRVRTTRPADVTNEAEVGTLTAQVRMGLVIAALGEVANAHAEASAQGPTTMNTLSLTQVLAEDLSFDSAATHAGCDEAPCGPVFNGRAGSLLSHGVVTGTSFWTRADLAVGLVRFLEVNPRDATTFTETSVQTLLESMSIDDNAVLYDEPGRPYDSVPPCTSPAVCAFEAPTPAEGTVLRGIVSMRVTAQDNRALRPAEGLLFTEPAGVVVDTITAPLNPEDPWLALATLDTNALPETLPGATTDIVVTITDEALNPATITRSIVIDRTAPDIGVTGAIDIATDDPVAAGAVTGAEELSITGTVSDLHGVAALAVSQNGGPASSVGFAGGTWGFDAGLVNGTNTFTFTATDLAGNVRSGVTVSYTRDATPPVLTAIESISGGAATIQDELGYLVSISGTGAGSAIYALGPSVSDEALASGISFAKFSTRYFNAAQPNLPRWRYDVSDNTTADGVVLFEFRIRRGATVLVDWTTVGAVSGGVFNREVTVSGDLHAELGNVSGTYTIEARATDQFGNVSPVRTANWTQTILAPPMRFETTTAPTGFGAIGAKFPIHYSLDAPVSGGPGNNFSSLMRSTPANGGELYVARWRVTNPNPIPIRIRVATPTVELDYQSGRIQRRPIHGSASMAAPSPCELSAQVLPPGSFCYSFLVPSGEPGYTEHVRSETGRSVATGMAVTLSSGTPLLACAGCAANERELPPGFDGFVFATASPFSWLDSESGMMSDIGVVGDLSNKTGIQRNELTDPGFFFRQCDEVDTVAGNTFCAEATKRSRFKSMTRVKINFTRAEATLEARADTTGSFQVPNTTTPGLTGGTRNVNTSEDDFASFP